MSRTALDLFSPRSDEEGSPRVDPTKLPQAADFPYARVQYDSLKQGLLRRKEKGSPWQVRWFVLYHNALFAYKPHNPEPKPDAEPQLVIPLSAIGHERRHAMRVVLQRELAALGDEHEEPTATVVLESDLGHAVMLQGVLDAEDTEPLQVWLSAILQQSIRVERALLRARSARLIYDHLNRSRSRIAPSPMQHAAAPEKQSHWFLTRPSRHSTGQRDVSKSASRTRITERSSSKRISTGSVPGSPPSAQRASLRHRSALPGSIAASLTTNDMANASRSSPVLFGKDKEKKPPAADMELTLTDFLAVEEPPSPRRRGFTFGTPPSQRQLLVAPSDATSTPSTSLSQSSEATSPRLMRKTAKRALLMSEETAKDLLRTSSGSDSDAGHITTDDELGEETDDDVESGKEGERKGKEEKDGPTLSLLEDYVSLPKLPDLPTLPPIHPDSSPHSETSPSTPTTPSSSSTPAPLASSTATVPEVAGIVATAVSAPSRLSIALPISLLPATAFPPSPSRPSQSSPSLPLQSLHSPLTSPSPLATPVTQRDADDEASYPWFTVQPFARYVAFVAKERLEKATSASSSPSPSIIASPSSPSTLSTGLTSHSDTPYLNAVADSLYIVRLHAQFLAERAELRRELEALSEPDHFADLVRGIAYRAETYQLKEVATLVARCERPHLLLPNSDDSPTPSQREKNAAMRINPYALLDELQSELLRLSRVHKERYPELSSLLTQVAQYYAQYVSEAKLHPYGAAGLAPPIALRGSGLVTQRVLRPRDANRILGARVNRYGLRDVTSLGGVHFKRDPEAPGVEFAVSALHALLVGEGTPPSELVRVDLGRRAFTLLASRTVRGVNLKRVLEERPDLLRVETGALSMSNYSAHFLMGLLVDPNDNKPENFVARIRDASASGGRVELELVCVDNDLAFADPIGVVHELVNTLGDVRVLDAKERRAQIRRQKTAMMNALASGNPVTSVPKDEEGWTARRRYFVNVRNVTYLLPHAQLRIDDAVKRRFMALEPALVLLEWLRALHRQNAHYDAARAWSPEELEKLQLPLRLRAGTAATLYQKLQFAQDFLTLRPLATHAELLEALQPELAHYYRALVRRHGDDTLACFEHLFRGPYFDELPELASVRLADSDALGSSDGHTVTLNEFMDARQYSDDALAFVRDRKQSPLEAMAEFLAEIDFADEALVVQAQAVDIVCHLPLRHFVLIGCAAFDDRHLQFLLDAAPHLYALELVRCHSLTDLALDLLHARRQHLSRVVLTDCRGLSPAAAARFQDDPLIRLVFVPAPPPLNARLRSYARDTSLAETQTRARPRAVTRNVAGIFDAASSQGTQDSDDIEENDLMTRTLPSSGSAAQRDTRLQLRDALDLDTAPARLLARKRSHRASLAEGMLTHKDSKRAFTPLRQSPVTPHKRALVTVKSTLHTSPRASSGNSGATSDPNEEILVLKAQLQREREKNAALQRELEVARGSPLNLSPLSSPTSSSSSLTPSMNSPRAHNPLMSKSSPNVVSSGMTTLPSRPPRPAAPPPSTPAVAPSATPPRPAGPPPSLITTPTTQATPTETRTSAQS